MSLSILRRILVGKETALGQGGPPTRELQLDASMTPNRTLVEVANRHQRSRAGVIERVVGTKSTAFSIASQPLQVELLPWLLSMCLAGGAVRTREFVDNVKDANANAGSADNPTDPNSVVKYTFSPPVDVNPDVDSYALFALGDGTIPQQIKFLNMDSMTIGVDPSGAATMSASLRGHYPADYGTLANPGPGITPAPPRDPVYRIRAREPLAAERRWFRYRVIRRERDAHVARRDH